MINEQSNYFLVQYGINLHVCVVKAVYTTGKLGTDSSKKRYGTHNFSRLDG